MVSAFSHDKGYSFRVAASISGVASPHDRARVEWKQGGKLLATAACDLEFFPELHRGDARCESRRDKLLVAKGAIEAELIYTDDKTDRDYLVRTYKVTVSAWNEGRGTTLYQVLPDDALGAAWVRHVSTEGIAESQMPVIEFWMATAKTPGQTNMRCSVDGKRLDDIDSDIEPLRLESMDNSTTLEIEADHFTGKGHEVYHYEGHTLDWNTAFGAKSDIARRTFLVDHPGKWDCLLRDTATGKAFREFLFTVDAKGMIEQSAIQQGKHAIPTLPNVALIEVKIPADAGLDEHIHRDQIAKSLWFGLPWPER